MKRSSGQLLSIEGPPPSLGGDEPEVVEFWRAIVQAVFEKVEIKANWHGRRSSADRVALAPRPEFPGADAPDPAWDIPSMTPEQVARVDDVLGRVALQQVAGGADLDGLQDVRFLARRADWLGSLSSIWRGPAHARWNLWAQLIARSPADTDDKVVVAALEQAWIDDLAGTVREGFLQDTFTGVEPDEFSVRYCKLMDG